jgi:DnaJ-class molecular chaperone
MTAPAKDDCKDCCGTGNEIQAQPAVFGQPIKQMPTCPTCKGAGKKPS